MKEIKPQKVSSVYRFSSVYTPTFLHKSAFARKRMEDLRPFYENRGTLSLELASTVKYMGIKHLLSTDNPEKVNMALIH